MKRTVTDCDRCQAKDIAPVFLSLEVGFEEGAVGQEPARQAFDLCPACAQHALRHMAERLSHEAARAVARFLREGK